MARYPLPADTPRYLSAPVHKREVALSRMKRAEPEFWSFDDGPIVPHSRQGDALSAPRQ
ncbi:MAG: hypothetical protein QMD46_06065 [Methanomicrobiales archaeon]|nr:hypothetical protein [Methanomicrobiales archaeon]